MRGLVLAALLLHSAGVAGAFAVGRGNVDPETNMNIVSPGGRGAAGGATAGPDGVFGVIQVAFGGFDLGTQSKVNGIRMEFSFKIALEC